MNVVDRSYVINVVDHDFALMQAMLSRDPSQRPDAAEANFLACSCIPLDRAMSLSFYETTMVALWLAE